MSGKIQNIKLFSIDLGSSTPVLRYVLGSCFILGVTSLMNYDLAYLTSVLSLGFMAPGARPISAKQGLGMVFMLAVVTGATVLFSSLFLEYKLVFMPLLLLTLLWLYFDEGLPLVGKLFIIVSLVIIPFVSIDSTAIGSYIAVLLVFNAFMAISLSQLTFLVFPVCVADLEFEKKAKEITKQTENYRFKYALSIILILFPVLLLFYLFQWSSSVLVLTFIAILSVSPSLANPKMGMGMILANILGGLFGIMAFKMLTIVPNFVFMILLTLLVGLIFAGKLFSKHKLASLYGSGFSTFLLILGSVTSSEADAGEKVWSRVIQISIAVIYVVLAFGVLQKVFTSKKKRPA